MRQVTIVLKRVQYQTVKINSEEGYDEFSEDFGDFVDECIAIKESPWQYWEDENPTTGDFEESALVSFKVEEK